MLVFQSQRYQRSDVQLSLQLLGFHMTSPNLQTIDSSEFLLPLGITEPKHLYLHHFGLKGFFSFCDRGRLNFQPFV